MVQGGAGDSWGKALAFYASLDGSEWSHISGFARLVAVIGRSDAATGLTAVTSHESLLISPYTTYPDWFEGRHVRVDPLTDGRVRVQYQPARFDRQLAETRTVELSVAAEVILELLAEL